MNHQIFLLSPAYAGGKRAQLLSRDAASFELALKVREGSATTGEVFAFLSGLYFRGKLAYAKAFARPPEGQPGALVITADRGLTAPERPMTLDELRAASAFDIHESDERYRLPLERDARALAAACSATEFVLLGSIATSKYAAPLAAAFGERLLFPEPFIGRGDMSRGGLMLRAAASGQELNYIPLLGAIRRGKRPPKLG